MLHDLTGRRFLVSGASSGIGEATARLLSGAGAAVAILARRETELLRVANEIGAIAVPADVTDDEAVQSAVEMAADRLSGLDGLVNVAGIVHHGSPTTGEFADWERMLRVNVLGLLSVTRATMPYLLRHGHGDIVNIGSMSGIRRASVRSTVYSGTKFAVHAISDGMREELSPYGIRVSVIAPSYVKTAIFDSVPDAHTRERMRTTLQEQGVEPDIVARQVLNVVSQPSGVCIHSVVLSST